MNDQTKETLKLMVEFAKQHGLKRVRVGDMEIEVEMDLATSFSKMSGSIVGSIEEVGRKVEERSAGEAFRSRSTKAVG